MVGNPDDEQVLINRARRGDLDAFNALILRYQDSAYTVAFRIMGDAHSAADAAQEAFITAYRRLSTYRGGSFRAWLLRITTNHCYDELRRRQRRPAVSVDELGDDPPLPDDADTPEEVVQQRELQRAIQNCISALNDDQRIALVLSDVEGLDYQAIADSVGVQIGTVKSRLSRARAAVRDCLQGVRELLPPAYRLISDESVD
ncbi:MAG TPA: sigma-70 family RNA polymerase sigma factor [Phototrophicaceae bacterium]|nr:sigma-70 family RNA polymerase sigma factor [Phototrophicaceae bacterium]